MVPVRYNLRSLFERRATSLMTVLGLGMVAMIFVRRRWTWQPLVVGGKYEPGGEKRLASLPAAPS